MDLRKQRINELDAMHKISQKAKEDGESFRHEDQLEWERRKTTVEQLEIQIRDLEEDRLRAMDNAQEAREKREGRSKIGQIMRGLANPGAKDLEPEIRALTSTGATATIQDPNVQNDFLIKLQDINPLSDLGARFVQVDNNSQWARVTALPDVTWQATETTQIADDASLTLEARKIDLKDMVIRIPVHNNVLTDSSGLAERLIEASALTAIDQALQTAIYHGSGSSGQFQGIIKTDNTILTGVNSIDQAGVAATFDDYLKVVRDLMNSGVPAERIGWVMSPEAWYNLQITSDSVGQYIMPPKMLGFDNFKATGAITTALNSSTETCAIAGDWSNMLIGLQGPITFKMLETKSDYLQTTFQIHLRADMMLTQPESFCVLYGLPLT